MAGPSTRDASPRGRAASGTSVTVNDVLAITVLLAAGLALRLIIAYSLLPGSGFPNDLSTFQSWAADMARDGMRGYYDRAGFLDYPPVYLLFLNFLGKQMAGAREIGDAIKVIPIFADLALAVVVWVVARDLGASRLRACAAAAILLINPITWFNSAIWGQADAVGSVFLLLGLRELIKDRRESAAALVVLATLTKLQLGILGFLVGFVILRRSAAPKTGAPDPLRILTSIGVGLLTAAIVCLPFTGYDAGAILHRLATTAGLLTVGAGLLAGVGIFFLALRLIRSVAPGVAAASRAAIALGPALITAALFGGMVFDAIVRRLLDSFGGYPWLTVNAYNPWALVATPDGQAMDRTLSWIRDSRFGKNGFVDPGFVVGPFSASFVTIAVLLLFALAAVGIAAWHRARSHDPQAGDTADSEAGAVAEAGRGALAMELRALAAGSGVVAAVIGFFLYAHLSGGLSAQVVGDSGLIAILVGVGVWAAWRDDRHSLAVALAIMAIAFFAVPTRSHERYLFPFFGVGALLLAVSWRWTIAYVALTVANMANLLIVLVQYDGIPARDGDLATSLIYWGVYLRKAMWPEWIDWPLLLIAVFAVLIAALAVALVWRPQPRLPEGVIWLIAALATVVTAVYLLGYRGLIWPIELSGVVVGVVLVWMLLQLRGRAVATLAREAVEAGDGHDEDWLP